MIGIQYSGCGKERRILIGPLWIAKAAPVWNYLEVYWPYAGGLSAVNTIGTQLRDLIKQKVLYNFPGSRLHLYLLIPFGSDTHPILDVMFVKYV